MTYVLMPTSNPELDAAVEADRRALAQTGNPAELRLLQSRIV